MNLSFKPIFACRVFIFGMFKLNVNARQDLPTFLIANLLSMHFVILDIDKIYLLAQVLLNTHLARPLCCTDKKVIDLRNLKVRTE